MTVDSFRATPSMTGHGHGATRTVTNPARVARPISLRAERAALVAVDLLMAAFAAVIGMLVRFGDAPAAQLPHAILLPPVWVIGLACGGSYSARLLATGFEEYRRVLNAVVWIGAGIAIGSFMLHLDLSRGFVAITLPMAAVLTLLGRCVARRRLHSRLARGYALHRVVMVGSRPTAEQLTEHMERHASAGYQVVATMDPLPHIGSDDPEIREAQVSRLIHGLAGRVRALGADTIAVTSSEALGHAGLQRLSWELEGSGVKLMMAPNLTDVAGPRVVVQPVAGLPLLHIAEPCFTGGQRIVKESMDRLGAGLLLVLLSPVLGVIALLSRISQGKGVIYSQKRVGLNGETFTCHKFRTMRTGADLEQHLLHINEKGGGLAKSADDPRITPLGRVLRKYSLDELPQLWDVLTGSMSLVGPRPQQPFEVERYSDDARRRLLVKPGITGLWQVSGRCDISWEEWVRLDLHYVENWSVSMDLLLLWKTVFAVLRPQGAY